MNVGKDLYPLLFSSRVLALVDVCRFVNCFDLSEDIYLNVSLFIENELPIIPTSSTFLNI